MVVSFLKYLAFEKRYSKHTVASYETDLRQYSTFIATEYQLESAIEADYNVIRGWIVSLIEKKIEPRSVNRKIACLKSYYKYLIRQGTITKNPTLRIKSPKVKKRLPVFIPERNMDQLLTENIDNESFSACRDQLIIELLYGTGIRLSELIGLTVADINFYDHSLKVLGKGNKERVIPIHYALEMLIKTYNKLRNDTFHSNDTDALIVTNKGTKAYPMYVQRIVKKSLATVSNAEKKSPHVLRHSFATHLLNKGADLNSIKDLMGHANLSATQIYTHNSLEKLKNIFKQAHPKA